MDAFVEQLTPGTGLYPMLPGELAVFEGDEGCALLTMGETNQVQQIIPYISELAGVYINDDTLATGDVLVYDPNVGPTGNGGWTNKPSPPPDLSGNSLFDLGDIALTPELQSGNTIAWSGDRFRPAKAPTQAIVGDLANVVISAPGDGQTLVYNAQTGNWKNEYLPENLGALTDVDLDTTVPTDGDVLIYNNQRELWEAGAVAGGNANVEIIDPSQPFPNLPLRTLGVSPITDVGDPELEAGGDFYWVQDEATNQWGKALREGEVEFDDFKDVSTEGIQDGQTLVGTFNGKNYSYSPASVAKPADRYTLSVDYTQNFFVSAIAGEEGAGGYCYLTQSTDEYDSDQRFLEVHGQRADGSRNVIVHKPDIADKWTSGCWDFTGTEIQPGPTGMKGFRPFSNNEGWDVIGGSSDFLAGIDIYPTLSNLNCRLVDLGALVIELVNGIVQATVKVNGQVFSTSHASNASIPVGQLSSIQVRVRDDRITTYINGVDVLGSIPLPAGATADFLDGTEAIPVPSAMTQGAFQGYVGKFWGGLGGYGGFSADALPVTTGVGRLVITGDEKRLLAWEYDSSVHGYEPMKSPLLVFGRSVKFLDMADVDTQSFYEGGKSGVVMWDQDTKKFINAGTEDLEWIGAYSLRNATDVSYYTDTQTFLEDGQILAWSQSRRLWRPVGNDLTIKINDADDVDVLANNGLSQGSILRWNESTSNWEPDDAPESYPIPLGSLVDVNLGFTQLVDGDTLLYSEALDAWVAGPLPGQSYATLDSLEDTELEQVEDRDILQYDSLQRKWVNADNPDPVTLDEFQDVRFLGTPKSGQVLQRSNGYWTAGSFVNYSAQGIEELIDVDARDPRPGEALIWNGSKWKNTPIAAGRGDGGDFDVTFTGTGFVSGVFGGGDFDTSAADLPIERLPEFLGGGDFT